MKKLYYLQNPKMPKRRPRWETLSAAERWLSDGFDLAEMGAGIGMISIDMSRWTPFLRRERGREVTLLNALMSRASALAIARFPHLAKMALGYRRYYPEHVDVALAVAGETFLTPLLLLSSADIKTIEVLAAEIEAGLRICREEQALVLRLLNRWGWILPFASLRRGLLRLITRQLFVRAKAGLLQLTYMPKLDLCAPLKFSATAMLGFGDVREQVVAVNGQAVIRPTLTLCGSFNHKVWDGMCAQRVLSEIQKILETESVESLLAPS